MAVLVVVGAAILAGSYPSGAFAYVDGADAVRSNAPGIKEWLRRGSGSALPPGTTCGTVCSDLWLSEHRPMPNQPASRKMWYDLNRANLKARRVALLRAGFGTLGFVGAATGVFAAGWQIGTTLRPLFYDQTFDTVTSSPGTTTPYRWYPRLEGQSLGNVSVGTETATLLAPYDGWELRMNQSIYLITAQGICAPSIDGWQPPAINADEVGFKRAKVISESVTSTATGGCTKNGTVYGPQANPPTPQGEVGTIWAVFAKENPTPPREGAEALPEKQEEDTGTPSDTTLSNAIETLATSTDPDLADVRQMIWSALEANIPDPRDGQVLPDCAGLTLPACIAELEEAGFLVHTTTVTSPEEADLTLPAGAVVDTVPAPGVFTPVETEIEIRTNPDPLPVEVLAPLPGETAEAYVDRLTEIGLLGEVEVLSETLLDPAVGPNAVSRVAPEPGTRMAPGETVTVTANPPTAPVVGAAGGCDPWVEPSLDLQPLNVPLGQVFPFAIPFWIGGILDQLVGSPVTPEWTFPFPFVEEPVTISLELLDPHMPEIRALLLVLATASMLWLFVGLAWGSPGGGRSEKD